MNNNEIITKEDKSVAYIINTKKSVLESRLKINGIDRSFEDYANDIVYAVSKSDDLQKCKPTTVVDSAFQLAKYGLSIGGNISHLVPFGSSCTFQIGYEGYGIMLNKCVGIKAQLYETVYEDDAFDYEADTIQTDEDGFLKSKAKIKSFVKGNKRSEIKGAFAYILLSNGNSHLLYMDKAKINQYKPSKISGMFWGKWDDLMYSKQAFKILARKLLKSYCHTRPEIMEAVGEDENQNIKEINQVNIQEESENLENNADLKNLFVKEKGVDDATLDNAMIKVSTPTTTTIILPPQVSDISFEEAINLEPKKSNNIDHLL